MVRLAAHEDAGVAVEQPEFSQSRIEPRQKASRTTVSVETHAKVTARHVRFHQRFGDTLRCIWRRKRIGVEKPEGFSHGGACPCVQLKPTAALALDDLKEIGR